MAPFDRDCWGVDEASCDGSGGLGGVEPVPFGAVSLAAAAAAAAGLPWAGSVVVIMVGTKSVESRSLSPVYGVVAGAQHGRGREEDQPSKAMVMLVSCTGAAQRAGLVSQEDAAWDDRYRH